MTGKTRNSISVLLLAIVVSLGFVTEPVLVAGERAPVGGGKPPVVAESPTPMAVQPEDARKAAPIARRGPDHLSTALTVGMLTVLFIATGQKRRT